MEHTCELTILMPCLNESETLATCIMKAKAYLERSGVDGEVLIADNGSTDGSREIARGLGARVVDVAQKGYGAALLGGIAAARGKYIIMGDADDSYDFPASRSLWTSCARAWIWSWATASGEGSLPGPCRRSTVIWAIRS